MRRQTATSSAKTVRLSEMAAAQAVPRPLSVLAAYLGASMRPAASGRIAAAVRLGATYLPSALHVWAHCRHRRGR